MSHAVAASLGIIGLAVAIAVAVLRRPEQAPPVRVARDLDLDLEWDEDHAQLAMPRRDTAAEHGDEVEVQ